MNRLQFDAYVMRMLGEGAIRINVTAEQKQDCIDRAIRFFLDNSTDGSERVLMAYSITQSDVDNNRLVLPAEIVSVTAIQKISRTPFSSVSDVEQAALTGAMFPNGLFAAGDGCTNSSYSTMSIPGSSILEYLSSMSVTGAITQTVKEPVLFKFNSHSKKMSLYNHITAGEIILIEAESRLDPDEVEAIFEDVYLQELAAAFVGVQWGNNLLKFDNVAMPGGNSVNGSNILSRYREMEDKAREEIRSKLIAPPIARFA